MSEELPVRRSLSIFTGRINEWVNFVEIRKEGFGRRLPQLSRSDIWLYFTIHNLLGNDAGNDERDLCVSPNRFWYPRHAFSLFDSTSERVSTMNVPRSICAFSTLTLSVTALAGKEITHELRHASDYSVTEVPCPEAAPMLIEYLAFDPKTKSLWIPQADQGLAVVLIHCD